MLQFELCELLQDRNSPCCEANPLMQQHLWGVREGPDLFCYMSCHGLDESAVLFRTRAKQGNHGVSNLFLPMKRAARLRWCGCCSQIHTQVPGT